MKLLALDGNSIINRAFYGVRPLTTKDGQHTNAIHGFMTMFLKMLDEEEPDAVAIAFDVREPTFRHRQYEGYKAKRKGMPDELYSQLEPLKELLTVLGYRIVTAPGWEADDILGTLSRRCFELDSECVIATGDRDSFQLINDSVTVRMLTTKAGHAEAVMYNEQTIMDTYGVSPRQLIDIKAIQGDSSDNIPGVAGIGEKGAGELIRRFGSLDAVYENINDPTIKEGMRKKLIEGRDSAYMSYKLGTIVFDAPVDLDMEVYRPAPADRQRARALLVRLEMFKLIERLGLADAKSDSAQVKTGVRESDGQVLFDCDGWEERLRDAGEVYFVYECTDGVLTSVSFPLDNDTVVLTGKQLDRFAEAVLPDESIRKHTYDTKTLLKLVPQAAGFVMDAMLAAYLLNASASDYSLERLFILYASELPSGLLPALKLSACAQRIRTLCTALANRLERNEQTKLLTEIELPLAQVLADMETLGVEVDSEGIKAFGSLLTENIAQLECAIHELVGYEFNINSPKQLGEALFEKLGLKGGKKTKTGWSTSAEVLEGLRGQSEAVDAVLQYRTLSKLNSTYCAGLLKTVAPDGRIHSSFNQTETRTGRISSTEPNLQNIPVRTELGSQMRKFFRARDGWVLVDCDYSQIELRVLAHCADDKRMIEGFSGGEDIHRITASQVFGVPLDEVTPRMRSNAKAVNFGIVYGIGAYSLAKDIGVSNAEASAYIKGYLNTYSGVDAYMKRMIESAREKGYAETLYGRRRDLPELSASNHMTRAFGERVARNMPIQGTAADIIKIAMVRVFRRLREENMQARLILQVHDELILEAPESEAERALELLCSEMENAAQLSVKLQADGHIGKTWYEAKG